MVLKDIPTVEELAEITGQSVEQLRRDRDAVSQMARGDHDAPQPADD